MTYISISISSSEAAKENIATLFNNPPYNLDEKNTLSNVGRMNTLKNAFIKLKKGFSTLPFISSHDGFHLMKTCNYHIRFIFFAIRL